ncbi:hypothetical protein NQ257_25860, partial [Escherichia coli]|nr:hypothetical protein [Escherichia coli]
GFIASHEHKIHKENTYSRKKHYKQNDHQQHTLLHQNNGLEYILHIFIYRKLTVYAIFGSMDFSLQKEC